MNEDNVKGNLQKIGGRIEESAGALVGDHDLKDAGREDQLRGSARETWGNVKDAGKSLIDSAKGLKHDSEAKANEVTAFNQDHESIIVDRDKV